jgi:hypothetical protein
VGGLKEISVRLCCRCYHLQYSSPKNPDIHSPNRKQTPNDHLNAMLAMFDAGSLRCFRSCCYITFDLPSTDQISTPPFSMCTFPSRRAVHRRATSSASNPKPRSQCSLTTTIPEVRSTRTGWIARPSRHIPVPPCCSSFPPITVDNMTKKI